MVAVVRMSYSFQNGPNWGGRPASVLVVLPETQHPPALRATPFEGGFDRVRFAPSLGRGVSHAQSIRAKRGIKFPLEGGGAERRGMLGFGGLSPYLNCFPGFMALISGHGDLHRA